MRKNNFASSGSIILMSVLVLMSAAPVMADVFDAVSDTWIRESDPSATFPDDLISVWPATSTDLARRNGVVMFNVAGFGSPITSAYVELFNRNDGRSQDAGLTQIGFLIDPPEIEDYSWEEYAAFDMPVQTALQSLASYDITPPDFQCGYQASDVASASDIAQLESRRSGSGLVTIVLEASAGERDWGDIEFDGTPPRLVLNEAAPVPPVTGDFTGDGLITQADFDVMTDPAHWLQSVLPGGSGDMNCNGFVDLDDFAAFKPIFNAAQNAVPEPGGLSLLTSAIVLMWCSRRRTP